MRFHVVFASSVLLGVVSLLPAEQLTIGRPAPKLPPLVFVKGEAVKELAKGRTYVVEFWGISCGPCIRCMPHLSELQQKHRDVVFLSVTSGREEDIRRFVILNNEKMGFRVAVSPKGEMWKHWMDSAGLEGIPTAFVVDARGVVAWIGHPEELDEPLSQILAGTLDPRFDVFRLRLEKAARAAFEKEDARLGKGNQVAEEVEKLVLAKKWQEAEEVVDRAVLKAPGEKVWYGMMKLGILTDEPGAAERAVELAINLAATFLAGGGSTGSNTHDELLHIAGLLAAPVSGKKPDPRLCDLALVIANRAASEIQSKARNEAADRIGFPIRLKMWLAVAHAQKGETEKAIAFTQTALEECRRVKRNPKEFTRELSDLERQLEAQLTKYQERAKKPAEK
jgi:thiol-disulfide isomerase/thioredoxin